MAHGNIDNVNDANGGEIEWSSCGRASEQCHYQAMNISRLSTFSLLSANAVPVEITKWLMGPFTKGLKTCNKYSHCILRHLV